MARLFGVETTVDDWHPLDNVPAPEYVPEEWIGPHVGVRMVDGFRTLSRMPFPGVSTKSGFWPEYRHEWADLLAQQEADAEDQAADARAQNRARLLPTAEDVSRMERVIGWPAAYLKNHSAFAEIVQRVAMLRARELGLDAIARRLHRRPVAVRKQNQRGLDLIAAGLRRDGVAVF